MYFGTDSAVSTTIDNQIYRINEDGKKIWIVEDKLIFCSGNMNISYAIMDKYINNPIKSIQLLQQLAIELFDNNIMLEIIIGCIQNNKTIVYQISSYNGFEILEKTVSDNDIGVWTGGIKTNECLEFAYDELKQGKNIFNTYQNTFDNISFEGIGGQLSVYKLNKNECKLFYANSILENNIKRINSHNTHLIVADRLVGKILAGINLEIDATNSDGNHIFTVDSNSVNISGLALTITNGGLPSTQLDSTFVNSLVNLGTLYNGVKIDSTNGLVITRSDNKAKITLNATTGLEAQKNTGTSQSPIWVDTLLLDTNGNLNFAGNIVSGSDVLLNASTKTLDFSKFTVLTGTLGTDNIPNLNASKINVGTLTGITINGVTITGSYITAVEKLRIQKVSASNPGLQFGYDSGYLNFNDPAAFTFNQYGGTGAGISTLTLSAPDCEFIIQTPVIIESSLDVSSTINTSGGIYCSFISAANGIYGTFYGSVPGLIASVGSYSAIKSSDGNYAIINNSSNFQVVINGGVKFTVYSDGSKSGGIIELDGITWGMSPVDSPRFLIEDIIFDQEITPEGTLITLDDKFSRSINGYAVFSNRGDVVISNKTSNSFIASGNGIVDLSIKGRRIGRENDYWVEIPKPEFDLGATNILNMI